MAGKVGSVGEVLLAYFTLVWLFVRVNTKVTDHVPGFSEGPISAIIFSDVDPLVNTSIFVWVLYNLVFVPFEDVIVHHVTFFNWPL